MDDEEKLEQKIKGDLPMTEHLDYNWREYAEPDYVRRTWSDGDLEMFRAIRANDYDRVVAEDRRERPHTQIELLEYRYRPFVGWAEDIRIKEYLLDVIRKSFDPDFGLYESETCIQKKLFRLVEYDFGLADGFTFSANASHEGGGISYGCNLNFKHYWFYDLDFQTDMFFTGDRSKMPFSYFATDAGTDSDSGDPDAVWECLFNYMLKHIQNGYHIKITPIPVPDPTLLPPCIRKERKRRLDAALNAPSHVPDANDD